MLAAAAVRGQRAAAAAAARASAAAVAIAATDAGAGAGVGAGANPDVGRGRGAAGDVSPTVSRSDGTLPRAYDVVGVVKSPCGSGYGITLDGKTLRTPGRNPLTMPTESLAYAVAAEWQWQDTRTVQPLTMPMMTLAATAIDIMPDQRHAVIGKLLEYFSGDPVVCRAPPQAHSKDLPAKQAAAFDPIARWLSEDVLEGRNLQVTDSIFGVQQDEEVLWALREKLDAYNNWELTALNSLSAAGRSVTLALAVSEGRLTVREAIPLMRFDEEYQIAEWGLVEGGHDIDIADTKVRIGAGSVFLKLLNDGPKDVPKQ